MAIKSYFIIESNVVTNNVAWDGNTQTWTPPLNSIQLEDEITPAMVWQINSDMDSYELVEVIGAGDIGFTWDGTVLTTNQPQPQVVISTEIPASGLQEA
jgi:hypothetical protein